MVGCCDATIRTSAKKKLEKERERKFALFVSINSFVFFCFIYFFCLVIPLSMYIWAIRIREKLVNEVNLNWIKTKKKREQKLKITWRLSDYCFIVKKFSHPLNNTKWVILFAPEQRPGTMPNTYIAICTR